MLRRFPSTCAAAQIYGYRRPVHLQTPLLPLARVASQSSALHFAPSRVSRFRMLGRSSATPCGCCDNRMLAKKPSVFSRRLRTRLVMDDGVAASVASFPVEPTPVPVFRRGRSPPAPFPSLCAIPVAARSPRSPGSAPCSGRAFFQARSAGAARGPRAA